MCGGAGRLVRCEDHELVILFEFSQAEWIAIRLSLKVAIWAVATSLPLGVLLALFLARRRFGAGSCWMCAFICR